MSNSSLICYTKISPNSTNPRRNQIKKITIHHMAGNITIERCGEIFAPTSRQASSNYGIGTDGRIGMYVEEKNRAFTSGSADNDNQAITIEVANDGGAESGWHVSDKALASLIDLCVDICKRNGIKQLNYTGNTSGNLTMHCWFQATACPGDYLKSKFPYIANEVNKRLNQAVTPKPTYVGYLDAATTSAISGWAWNSVDDTALQVDVQISKDNKVVKTLTTTANIYRADLLNAKKGNGKHGFAINFDFNTLGAGTYTVKAYTNGKQLTNTKNVTVKESVNTPSTPSNTTTYTVVKGDSYYGIAKKLGDVNRYKEIQALNNNKALFAGSTILVPSDMGKSVVTTPSAKDTFLKNLRSALGLSTNATIQQIFDKTPTLKKNNTYNKVVAIVQTYLNTLGFNCGNADGYFGANTEKAVKAYQTKYTGIADGIMSAKGKMWKHLLGV